MKWMNAENGTGIQKSYFIYLMKKREIKPLSFISFKSLKILSPHFSKTTQRNIFVQKPHYYSPSPKLGGCITGMMSDERHEKSHHLTLENSGIL